MLPLIEYRTTANLLYYAAGTDEDEVAERRHWEAWKKLRVAINAELVAAEAKGARELAEKLLDELPAAVFIPDNATDEAYALGVGLAEYHLKVARMLIAELQRINSIKEAE